MFKKQIDISLSTNSVSLAIKESWTTSRIQQNKDVVLAEGSALHFEVEDDFKLSFADSTMFDGFTKYKTAVSFILIDDENFVDAEIIRGSKNSYKVVIWGNKERGEKIAADLRNILTEIKKENGVTVSWAYSNHAGGCQIKEEWIKAENLPFTEMYPFIQEGTLEQLYEDFYSDTANILILKGPAGTGKTSFIKGMLCHLNKEAYITYDESLANSDNFFSSFFSSKSSILIFEDADAFLTSRTDGNKLMHRFLNMGDGLISRPNKKIIFTTNLENLSDIDPALTRPGRCYDIIEFEPLTVDQAKAVAEISGKELDLPDNKVTIAEIFNTQKYRKEKKKSTIGFI